MVKYNYCSHCSAKNDSFNDFCTECGQKIDTASAASHITVQDNSSRVVVSGSYDAMYGTKEKKQRKTKTSAIFGLIAFAVFCGAVYLFWYLYNSNVADSVP